PTYPIKLDIQNSNFGEQKIVWVFTETQYRHESSNRYYLVITWLGGRQNVTVTYNQPFIRTDLKQNVEYTYILYAYMRTEVLISNVIVISTLPTSGPVQVDEFQATPIRFGIYISWTTIDRFFLTFQSFLIRIVPYDASVRVVEFQTTDLNRTLTDLLPCVAYNVSICARAQNGVCSSPTFTQMTPYPPDKVSTLLACDLAWSNVGYRNSVGTSTTRHVNIRSTWPGLEVGGADDGSPSGHFLTKVSRIKQG
ncbi:hypothetical protein EG68_11251, partial [Paragonimus skrjabini miyazakii]